MDKNINITLKVWRQKGPKEKGAFETYQLKNISQGSSFLEMLDVLNEQLVNEGREPVFFDHEPWRSAGFPIIRDLTVDRQAYDKIMQAGGFVSVNTGGVPDANAIPIPKKDADLAMDAAACIGCGACAAACKNGSAMLFVSAKVSQLALLPQGRVEATRRAKAMVAKMDELGFGNCTNTRACEAECPKSISVLNIARLNREFISAKLKD